MHHGWIDLTPYPYIRPDIEKGRLGKLALRQITGSFPWLWVTGLAGAAATGAALLER